MSVAAGAKVRLRRDHALNRLVYCLLLPLFLLVLGAQRLLFDAGADAAAASPQNLWAEARSQASIAASYALWARSLLHSSERRTRAERLS